LFGDFAHKCCIAGITSGKHSRQRPSQSANNLSNAAAWAAWSSPSKVPKFLPQQGVQLKTLPVAIQHPQQRCIDKPVARVASFRLRETGDFHCQRKPESLERAESHRIEQPTLFLGPCVDGAPKQSGNVMHFVAQSLKPQPARRLWNRFELALQHVGAPKKVARYARLKPLNRSGPLRCTSTGAF
jgi:hypothetical protein